ncbi:Nucleolar protein involved in 40S ribosome biogenesis [Handroanthus impetiginosus]|uniref:Nucleolar protein involved in 40S ribosome biogenesis n=1 Tax=Handroanthus impetiginosus TaxID=429701 RepID=A0A2G9HS44_9LAMI|nr:Nucleolar protein involved in 40S ribosome biogenesis [Handroanthus impetiginosus]
MAKKSSTESSKKKKSKNKIKNKLSVLNSEAKKVKGPKENPFESIWSRRKFDILGKKRKDDERRRIGLSRSIRPKSKKEVMEDIIFKSKFFKAQKAKDKEENEQFIEQLDKDFTSLVQSQALLSLTQPSKMKALNALVNNRISNENAKKEDTDSLRNKLPLHQLQEKPDHYDKLVGEMALDMRAQPSDRTKTPEELAQAEKERLEQLEEERQKRMFAADDSSNEEGNTSEDDDDESTKRIRHVSGDDLGDSFSQDATLKTKVGWIEEILKRENARKEDAAGSGESEEEDDDDDGDDDEDADGSDEDHGEDEKVQSLKDWEQSDDENIETNLEEEEEDEEEEEEEEDDDDEDDDGVDKQVDIIDHKKITKSGGKQNDSAGVDKVKTSVKEELHQKGELPYTIEAPKTFEELNALLENRSDDHIVEAIRRIRTFNAISIAAENRKKMQVFYGVLLQYFAVLANKKPLNFKLLNMLVKPLMEMSSEIPYFAAICARQRLLRTRTQFCEDIKNTGKSCWPSLKTLFLLRLWSLIFPCSDFRHAVMTPAVLLMSEYLMRCPVVSGRDIAIGSFLCSMVLSISRQSQKFCPEALTFIQTMLMAALNNKQTCEDSQLYHLMELKTLRPLLHIQGRVEEIKSLDFLTLMDLPDDSPYFTSDTFRASILSAIIGNLKGFVTVYEGFKSFPEIFLPISKILHGLAEEDQIPDALKVEIKDVAQHITAKSEEHHLLRQPLRLRKQKIIKTAVPKFEENFVKGRDYDPDRERAERKKLKKRLKQEAKGAIRELRKDNYFLLEVKEKENVRMEEEKAEKYGKYRAFLQEQEHAFKSGQLGKGKGSKRRR